MNPSCEESIDGGDGFLADLMMRIVASALHEDAAMKISRCNKWERDLHDLLLKLKQICFSEGLHDDGQSCSSTCSAASTTISIQRSINALSSSRFVASDSFTSRYNFTAGAEKRAERGQEGDLPRHNEKEPGGGHQKKKTSSPHHSENTVNCLAGDSADDFRADNAVLLVRARPLHIACTYPFFSAEFIELLLKAGANPRLRAIRERSRCDGCRSQFYFSDPRISSSFGTQGHKDGSAPILMYCLCCKAMPGEVSSRDVWGEASDLSLRPLLSPSDGHSRCTCAQDHVSENEKQQVKNKITTTDARRVAAATKALRSSFGPIYMYMYLPSTYPIHCLVDRFAREVLGMSATSSTLSHPSEDQHNVGRSASLEAPDREHGRDLETSLNENNFIKLVEALEKAATPQPSSKGIDSSAPLRCLWCPISILSTINESKESLSTAVVSRMLHYASLCEEKRCQKSDGEQSEKEEEEQNVNIRKWSVSLLITALQYLIRREAEEHRGNCRAQRLRRRAARARVEEELRERARNAHEYMFECQRPLPPFSELNGSSSPLVHVLKRVLDSTLDPADVIKFIPCSSPPPPPLDRDSLEDPVGSGQSNPLITIIDFFTDILGVDVDQSGVDGTALYLLCEHCRLSPSSFWRRSYLPSSLESADSEKIDSLNRLHPRGWDAEAEEAVEHLLLVSGADPNVASCGSVRKLLPLQAFIRSARKGRDETAHPYGNPRYTRRRFEGMRPNDTNKLSFSTGRFVDENCSEQPHADLRRSSSFPLSEFRLKRDARLIQMIKLFVTAGADMRATDGSGQSALYLAACYCTPFVISSVLKLIKIPPTTTADMPAACTSAAPNLLHCVQKAPKRDFSADPTYGVITQHKAPPVFVPLVALCARVGLFPVFTSPSSGRLIGEFFDSVADTCLFTVDYKGRSAMSEMSRIADPIADQRDQVLRRKEVEKMALERTRAFVRSRRRHRESETRRGIFAERPTDIELEEEEEEKREFARRPRRVSGASDELCGLSLSRALFFRFVDHGGVLNLELFFKFMMPERRHYGPLVSSPSPHLLPFVQLLLDTSAVDPAVIFKALRGLLDSYNRYHLLQGSREREVMVLLKSNWVDFDPLLQPF